MEMVTTIQQAYNFFNAWYDTDIDRDIVEITLKDGIMLIIYDPEWYGSLVMNEKEAIEYTNEWIEDCGAEAEFEARDDGWTVVGAIAGKKE